VSTLSQQTYVYLDYYINVSEKFYKLPPINEFMILRRQKITIVQVRKPIVKQTVNENLLWFGNSLGLFNLRDKDKSCYRIFVVLLKSSKSTNPTSSDELAFRLNLSRGTVVHHLNKLMDSGIVINVSGGYILRVGNLRLLIEELEKDVVRTLDNLKTVAESIDESL